jgi:hypothetical protein
MPPLQLLAEQLSELEARHAKQEEDLAREMLEFQAQMMRWSSVSAPAPAPSPAPAPAPPAPPIKVYRTDPETGLPVRADGHHSPPVDEQLPLPSPPSSGKPKAKKAGVSPSAKSAGSPTVATGGAAQAEHSKKYVGVRSSHDSDSFIHQSEPNVLQTPSVASCTTRF